MKTTNAVAIAVAAASLFAFVPLSASASSNEGGVQCMGANACKGHNDCKSEKNACKGHAECKGQGWVHADSEKACTDMGGTVMKHEAEEKKQ